MGDESCRVFGIAQQTRDITHEDEPLGFKSDRDLCGRDVCIAIIEPPVLSQRSGADDRSDALLDAFQQRSHFDPNNVADETRIELFTVRAREPALAAGEDFRPGKSLGLSAKRVDGLDDLRIDLTGKDLIDYSNRSFIGDSLALHEAGFQSRLLHRSRDSLASAMHHYRINLHRFQKHEIPGDSVANSQLGGVHKAAAVFDDECFPAVTL